MEKRELSRTTTQSKPRAAFVAGRQATNGGGLPGGPLGQERRFLGWSSGRGCPRLDESDASAAGSGGGIRSTLAPVRLVTGRRYR